MRRKNETQVKQIAGLLTGIICMILICLLGTPDMVQAGTLTGVTNVHQTDAGSNFFIVEWDKDINAAGYEFQYSMDGNNWSSSTYTGSMSHRVSNLNSGRSYYIRLRSYDKIAPWHYIAPSDNAAFSAWSDPIEVITTPKTIESDTIRQTAGTNSTITVTWEAAEGATEYAVMYNLGGSWFSAGNTTATTYTIQGLDPDTNFSVSIKAIRESSAGYSCGYYENYGHDCYTTSPKIKSPALQSWETKKNRITIQWDETARNYSGYEVYVTNLSGKKVKNFKTTSTEYTFKLSSVKNQGFIFKVRAYKDIDGTAIYGEWSNEKVVIAQPNVSLKKSGQKTLQVSWAKIKGATGYTVYRSTNPDTGFKKIKTLTGTKLKNTGLNPNKTYYYYVVANGVKVNKKTYKSTTAEHREIAYMSYYSSKVSYYYQY